MGGQEEGQEEKREGIQTCCFKPVQPMKSPGFHPAPTGELPAPASFPGDGREAVCVTQSSWD